MVALEVSYSLAAVAPHVGVVDQDPVHLHVGLHGAHLGEEGILPKWETEQLTQNICPYAWTLKFKIETQQIIVKSIDKD